MSATNLGYSTLNYIRLENLSLRTKTFAGKSAGAALNLGFGPEPPVGIGFFYQQFSHWTLLHVVDRGGDVVR